TMLLIPAMLRRRKFLSLIPICAIGLLVFYLQSVFWPLYFEHYLESINLMFKLNHDFGCGPVGILETILAQHGIGYMRIGEIAYAFYSISMLGILLFLAHLYSRGKIAFLDWMPILIVGVILLNPRLIEYDVAAMTIPLAVLLVRIFKKNGVRSPSSSLWIFSLLFANITGVVNWTWRKIDDGILIMAIFTSSIIMLFQRTRHLETHEVIDVCTEIMPPVNAGDSLARQGVFMP
ncbi:MAG: hypothetical protein KGK08_09680, partial [Acidobacteriota bacterium]|nr:hypothetical protein [Acidobacteriota bacterium]